MYKSDSPNSKHDLNDVKEDNNINEPFSGHSSYEINNDRSEHNEDVVSFRSKNGEGRVEIHTTLHKTFPPPAHSDILSFDLPIYETPSLSTSRTVDLVRQPSRWGAALPKAIGLNTGGCKAYFVALQSSTLKPPTSSSCLEGSGMALFSDTVLPSAHPNTSLISSMNGPSSQLSDMISVRKHSPHPDRVFCRLTKEKLVIKTKK